MIINGKDIMGANSNTHRTAVTFFDIQNKGVFKVRIEHGDSLMNESKDQQQYQTDAKTGSHRADVSVDLFAHTCAGSEGRGTREIQADEGNTR
jgi:hypothetical protein